MNAFRHSMIEVKDAFLKKGNTLNFIKLNPVSLLGEEYLTTIPTAKIVRLN